MPITLQENLRGILYTPFYAALSLGAYRHEGVEAGFVTVVLGMGKTTLTCPVLEVSIVVPLVASVRVMIEAEEINGALR